MIGGEGIRLSFCCEWINRNTRQRVRTGKILYTLEIRASAKEIRLRSKRASDNQRSAPELNGSEQQRRDRADRQQEPLYKHSENSTKEVEGGRNERITENQNQTEGL